MKKILLALSILTLLYSCNSNPEKDRITDLLKEKIGDQLPFKDVKIAQIENGTGVIVDGSWCYWVNDNNKIFCVNGSSKSIYNVNNPECEDAPIKAMFSDIEKITK
ncbi:MAG TPA: hypothetical protein VGA80_16425 [Flavobacteriaceae bacterium]|jgi:hypothetical protein